MGTLDLDLDLMSIARSIGRNQNLNFQSPSPFPLPPTILPLPIHHPDPGFKTGSPSSSSTPYQPRAQSDSSFSSSAKSPYRTRSSRTHSRTTPLALLRWVMPSLWRIPALLRGITSLLGRIITLWRGLLAVSHGRRLLVVSTILRWRRAVRRRARRVGRAAIGRLRMLRRGSAVLGGLIVLARHFG